MRPGKRTPLRPAVAVRVSGPLVRKVVQRERFAAWRKRFVVAATQTVLPRRLTLTPRPGRCIASLTVAARERRNEIVVPFGAGFLRRAAARILVAPVATRNRAGLTVRADRTGRTDPGSDGGGAARVWNVASAPVAEPSGVEAR